MPGLSIWKVKSTSVRMEMGSLRAEVESILYKIPEPGNSVIYTLQNPSPHHPTFLRPTPS